MRVHWCWELCGKGKELECGVTWGDDFLTWGSFCRKFFELRKRSGGRGESVNLIDNGMQSIFLGSLGPRRNGWGKSVTSFAEQVVSGCNILLLLHFCGRRSGVMCNMNLCRVGCAAGALGVMKSLEVQKVWLDGIWTGHWELGKILDYFERIGVIQGSKHLPVNRKEILKAKRNLGEHFAASTLCIIEKSKNAPEFLPADVYFVVLFEPLHNVLLGVSKLWKICFARYVGFATSCPKESGSGREGETFGRSKWNMFWLCNTLQAWLEKEF